MLEPSLQGALMALAGAITAHISQAWADRRRYSHEELIEEKRAKREHLQWKRVTKYDSYRGFCSFVGKWEQFDLRMKDSLLDEAREKVVEISLLANKQELKKNCSSILRTLESLAAIHEKIQPILKKKAEDLSDEEARELKTVAADWKKQYARARGLSEQIRKQLSDDLGEY